MGIVNFLDRLVYGIDKFLYGSSGQSTSASESSVPEYKHTGGCQHYWYYHQSNVDKQNGIPVQMRTCHKCFKTEMILYALPPRDGASRPGRMTSGLQARMPTCR
jgi:hypothetical protein